MLLTFCLILSGESIRTGIGTELRMSDLKSKVTDKHNHMQPCFKIECSHKHVYIMFCFKINVAVFRHKLRSVRVCVINRDMSDALAYFGLKIKLGQGDGFKSNLPVPLDVGNAL